MSGFQTFFVIGSLILLSLLALTVNRTILTSDDSIYNAQYIIEANNLAQQIINEISTKKFDEAVVSGTVEDKSEFSQTLGAESGETIFDDVDDYNNHFQNYSTPTMDSVSTIINVSYVNPGQPDNISDVKTNMKRVTVKVFSNVLPDTLKMYYYSSY